MWWLWLLIKMGLDDSNTRRIITVTHPALTCSHDAPCKLTTPPQSSNPQFLSHSPIPSLSLCLEMLIFCLVKIPSPNIYTHSDAAIVESCVCNQTVLVQVTPEASTSPDCFKLADSWPEGPSSGSRLQGLQDKLLEENYFCSYQELSFCLHFGWCELLVRRAQGRLRFLALLGPLFIVCWRLALWETICLAFCSRLFMKRCLVLSLACPRKAQSFWKLWNVGTWRLEHTALEARTWEAGYCPPVLGARFLHASLALSCCFSGSEADFSSSSSTGSISAPEVHMSTAGNKRASFSRK